MARQRSTTGSHPGAPATGRVGRRRQLRFAAGLVAAFLLVGVGVGLAGRFGMEFVIELFDVRDSPTSNQYVGIVFLVNIFVVLFAGVVLSGVSGLVTGLSFRRRAVAATIAGGASLVGFALLAIPALLLMVSVLGGGGGGGGGGPDLPTAAVWQSALVATGVAAAAAAIGSAIGH